jgi:hypothetical protein
MEVYPPNVKFGDIVFTFATVKNMGNLTLSIENNLRHAGYPGWMHSIWDPNMSEKLYEWQSEDFFSEHSLTRVKGCSWERPKTSKIAPAEKLMVCFRPLWIPPADLSGGNCSKAIVKLMTIVKLIDQRITLQNQENVRLRLLAKIDIRTEYQPSPNIIVLQSDEAVQGEFSGIIPFCDTYMKNHGFVTDSGFPLNSVTIHAREKQIYELIRDWYSTIPCPPKVWSDGVLFQYCHFDRDSPIYSDNHSNISLEDINGKTKLTQQESLACRQFEKNLNFRSEFISQRIKRSKKLEAELLNLPDSELSQNMKEFIKLRGHLVDIRFAENAVEEEKAFNNFVTFIEQSKDKELWIRFVVEIAFDSIIDNEHFPLEKVQNYRKRFAEKFTSSKEILK